MVPLMVCSLLLPWQPPSEKPTAEPGGEVVLFKFPADKSDDLQSALANHPDVQIAEARLRVAQAELAKTKLLVAQQVTATRAKLTAAKAEADSAERSLKRVQSVRGGKEFSMAEREVMAQKAEQSKAAVAVIETELRSLLGEPIVAKRADVATFTEFQPLSRLEVHGYDVQWVQPVPVAGTVADKLRAALTKPVALKDGLQKVKPEEALDGLKRAGGLDLIIKWGPGEGVVSLPPGERTLPAWLDLLADEFDQQNKVRFRVTPYVREYGLLLAAADSKPQGAISLEQFAKQRPKAEPTPAVSPELRDRLRKALAKTVNRSEMTVPPAHFFKELFATAGPELLVQSPLFTDDPITIPGGEKTVAAWLQQLQDKYNGGLKPGSKHEFFVRDYGLLFCASSEAPPGAVPLSAVK